MDEAGPGRRGRPDNCRPGLRRCRGNVGGGIRSCGSCERLERGGKACLGLRNMNMESLYEYGSRAGFWRLYRAFTQRGLPVTVYAVAMALERNPPAVAAMVAAGWEMATHGYRWIDYQYVAEAVEREHIAKAVAIHTQTTGTRPLGWYQGRCSPNTRRLVAEEGGFLYNADSSADDLPYWDLSTGKPQLIVPYAFDSNDTVSPQKRAEAEIRAARDTAERELQELQTA